MNNRKKKSVTILTGALGAGKTTLLNNIIKKHPGKKFVIIENEFGDINIDKKLIGDLDGNSIYELTNGCICCSLAGELGVLLNMLIMSDVQFDHLIIETTGIADPNQFLQIFLTGSRANEYFELDSVICLIDAEYFLLQITQIEETKKQLIAADTILINKLDYANEETVSKIENTIKKFNHEAAIHKTTHCDIADIDVLNVHLHTVDRIEESFNTVTLGTENSSDSHSEHHHHHDDHDHSHEHHHNNEHKHDHNHHEHEHHHNHEIDSFSIVTEGEYDKRRFVEWLDSYLLFSGEEIYRFKGILNAQDSNNKFVLQGVYKTFLLFEGSPWKKDEQRTNQFVFIGKNLRKEEITSFISSLQINAEDEI